MDTWTPKTGKVVDTWTPKTGSVVQTAQEEPLLPEFQPKDDIGMLAGKGLANIIPGLAYASQYYQQGGNIPKAEEAIRPFESLRGRSLGGQLAEAAPTALGRLPFYMAGAGGAASALGRPIVGGALGFGGIGAGEQVLEGRPEQVLQAGVTSALSYPILHGIGKAAGALPTELSRRIGTGLGFGGYSALTSPPEERMASTILGGGLGVAFKPKSQNQYLLEKTVKLREQVIDEHRRILNIKPKEYERLEIKGGDKLNEALRVMAEENIKYELTPDGKYLSVEPAELGKLHDKLNSMSNDSQTFLKRDIQNKFSLDEIAKKAKAKVNEQVSNAKEREDSYAEIDNYITAEKRQLGKEPFEDVEVNALTLDKIKQGMWSVGYNKDNPSPQKNARRIGRSILETFDRTYPSDYLKNIHKKMGHYLDALSILEKPRPAPSKGAGHRVAQITGGIAGGMVGHSLLPIAGGGLGVVGGTQLGSKIYKMASSPERRSNIMEKRYGEAQKIEMLNPQVRQMLQQLMNKGAIPNPKPPTKGGSLPFKSVGSAGTSDFVSDVVPLTRFPRGQFSVKTLSGEKKTINVKPNENIYLTPESKGGKITYQLHDGDAVDVSKNTAADLQGKFAAKQVKGNFAPELEQVEEVVKGKPIIPEISDISVNDFLNKFNIKITPQDDGLFAVGDRLYKTEKDAFEGVRNIMAKEGTKTPETKFSQYQIPGGENYREIGILAGDPFAKAEVKAADLQRQLRDVENERIKLERAGIFNNRTYELQGKSAELMEAIDASKKERTELGKLPVFEQSHFPEWKNLLAHLRVNDRTTPDGKKVLFIEELQSDWAKEARKDAKGPEVLRLEGGYPSHPLLKNWQELALKRVLKEAVEGGYDYISWTTGEQQAARYDLSKQIDYIKWQPFNDGKAIEIKPKDGSQIAVYTDKNGVVRKDMGGGGIREEWKGKNLAEIIGKEHAPKVMEKESGKLSGEGLKIGGEWAKNLYDKQIPNILKDLTKGEVKNVKMGIIQEPDIMNGEEGGKVILTQPALKITPEMRASIKSEKPTYKSLGAAAGKGEEGKPFTPTEGKVWHETSISSLRDLMSLGDASGLNVSDNPNLALGQTGKGVKIEFDKSKLLGSRGSLGKIKKPGLPFSESMGMGTEYRLIGGETGIDKISKITIKSGTKMDKVTKAILQRQFNAKQLENGNWEFTPKLSTPNNKTFSKFKGGK